MTKLEVGDIVYCAIKESQQFRGLAVLHTIDGGLRWIIPSEETAKYNFYDHGDGSDAHVPTSWLTKLGNINE